VTPDQTTPPANVRFGQPSGRAGTRPAFGRSGTALGLAVTALIVAGLVWAAGSSAATSRHPQLFGGSLVLEDTRALSVLDLATADVTVRLPGIEQQVGAGAVGNVEAVPTAAGTMLVNDKSGTFNLLQPDNYLLDTMGGGVGLGLPDGTTAAMGYGAGADAYIVRSASDSTVFLVGAPTVAAAARYETGTKTRSGSPPTVSPLGFGEAHGTIGSQPGSAAVAGMDLWTLVATGAGCQPVEWHPTPTGLTSEKRGNPAGNCKQMSIVTAPGVVGVVAPGRVTVFTSKGPVGGKTSLLTGTSSDSSFLPVTGSTGGLWFLARSADRWSLFDVSPFGGPAGGELLRQLGPGSDPVAPVMSHGYLYTLDGQAAQPTLWQVVASTGAMTSLGPYPVAAREEKASFAGAQVLVDGPRVVFNNPESLEAVVVFTDGTHPPMTVDKTTGEVVSATGPADLVLKPANAKRGSGSSNPLSEKAVPVQQVSQQVTCHNTTEKPYAPLITAVDPSSQSALVAWSYQLLDQTDCEPDSWSVQVRALTGSHQPAQPVQSENGQDQYLFTGLRPSTTYRVVVTANINQQSTASQPATFTTPARGPDAPLSVTTRPDGRGDWIVSWKPCTEAANPNCVVPAYSWTVTGAACGSSFVGQPPAVQVSANETSVTVDSVRPGLLGDSLSFTVQGSLASGLAGNPTSDGSCTAAWRPPNPSAISLSDAGQVALDGQTVTATLQVNARNPVLEAFGSRSTQFIYRVGGQTVGPTTQTRVTVAGLAPGRQYTATVTAYPTGHPEAAVTLTGTPFTKNLAWPGFTLAVAPSVDAKNPNEGILAVRFPGLNATPTMSASGSYTCGSTQSQQVAGPIVNGTFNISVSLIDYGGACNLTVTVDDQQQNPDPYGVSSPARMTPFSIGTQPGYQFTDQVAAACQSSACASQQIEVDHTGTGSVDSGGYWSISSASKGKSSNDPCASTQTIGQDPTTVPTFPYTLTLPATCTADDVGNVDITISYKFLGTTVQVDAGAPTGTPATTTTSTTTACPSSTSSPTTCTPGASVAAAYLFRPPAGARALKGALEWSAAGLSLGWAMVGARRLRRRVANHTPGGESDE
jgi:Fibronectin type III domain